MTSHLLLSCLASLLLFQTRESSYIGRSNDERRRKGSSWLAHADYAAIIALFNCGFVGYNTGDIIRSDKTEGSATKRWDYFTRPDWASGDYYVGGYGLVIKHTGNDWRGFCIQVTITNVKIYRGCCDC